MNQDADNLSLALSADTSNPTSPMLRATLPFCRSPLERSSLGKIELLLPAFLQMQA